MEEGERVSDKYTIPTSQKEIKEIIADKVLEPLKKRGLKIYGVYGWSEVMGAPFIIQNAPDYYDLPRMVAQYPAAIQDTLQVIVESGDPEAETNAIASAEFIIGKLEEWLKPYTCTCREGNA